MHFLNVGLWLVLFAAVPAPAPAPGRLVDVGGHRLHVWCSGRGASTVVVENGFDEFSSDWVLVRQRVEAFARVCTYDRAGYAWSEPGPVPRTFAQIGFELEAALARLGERPPFVLVGHSFGGGVVRAYARDHPRDVTGLVLVDVVSENQRIGMGPRAVGYVADGARGRAIPAPTTWMPEGPAAVSPAPIAAPVAALDPPYDRLPAEARRRRTWALAQPARDAASDSEREWSAESMAVWRRAPQDGTLGRLPLLVLTRARGGYGDDLGVPAAELEAERLRAQAALARLSSCGWQEVVPSGHDMHVEVPEVVARAVRAVVNAAREGGCLPAVR